MVIDGRQIASAIRASVRAALARAGTHLTLGILSVGGDGVTQQFVGIKKKSAEETGVALLEKTLPKTASTEDVVSAVTELISMTNGVIVQLPLPEAVDRAQVLAALPASHDVDCLGDEARAAFANGGPLLPPVVSAIKEILERFSVAVEGKKVVVIGKGILVGEPAAAWFLQQGAVVTTLDEHDNVPVHTQNADIIVSGAGHPGLLKPGMIRDGVVLFGAGTSESGGKIMGDADLACAEKASLATPVPGGIGPVAVAKIFENLLICNSIPL